MDRRTILPRRDKEKGQDYRARIRNGLAATGVALADLAAAVIAKDNEWIAREVARRSAKLKGKSDA